MQSLIESYRNARVQLMPRPGRDPPELPQWLRIPYLVPVPGGPSEDHPPMMSSLIPQDDPQAARINDISVGTLGAIMISEDTCVALTASHVIVTWSFEDAIVNQRLS